MPQKTKVTPIKIEDPDNVETKSVELPETPETLPVTKRSCTDGIWCFSFLIMIAGLIICAVYTAITGEYKYIGRVYDSDGKLCGIDSGYEDYPYLYYPIPSTRYITKTVCMKSCPVSPLATTLTGLYKTNTAFTNTVATANDVTTIKAALDSGVSLTGSFFMYETLTFANQLCMPKKSGVIFTPLSNALLSIDLFGQWMGDLKETWVVAAIAVGIAVLIGLIFTFLMIYQSGALFVINLILTIAGLGFSGWMLSSKEDTAQTGIADTTDQDSDSIISKNKLAKQVVGFFFWGIVVLVYLSLLVFYQKLIMANRVMQIAADYIKKTPMVFIFAMCIVLISFIFFAAWTIASYFELGWGDISQIKIIPFGSTLLFNKTARYILIFFVFVFFWVSQFQNALAQFVIASSVSHWYFAQGTEKPDQSNLASSVGKALRYHAGSLALGSLILTLLIPLKLIFYFIGPDPYQAKQNKTNVDMLLCRCGCMMSLKRFLAIMDDSAYIQMALTGNNLYQAGKEVYALNVRNNVRMSPLRGIGNIFAFYSKVLLAGVATVAAVAAMTYLDKFSTKIYSPILTTILVFVFSYMVGHTFTTIYGVAINTLGICSMIEDERYRIHNVPFKHCPKPLRLLIFRAQRLAKLEKESQDEL